MLRPIQFKYKPILVLLIITKYGISMNVINRL